MLLNASVPQPFKFYSPPLRRPTHFLDTICRTSPYKLASSTRPAGPTSPTPAFITPESVTRLSRLAEAAEATITNPFNLRKPGDRRSGGFLFNGLPQRQNTSNDSGEMKFLLSIIPQFTGYRISRPYIIIETTSIPQTAPV